MILRVIRELNYLYIVENLYIKIYFNILHKKGVALNKSLFLEGYSSIFFSQN